MITHKIAELDDERQLLEGRRAQLTSEVGYECIIGPVGSPGCAQLTGPGVVSAGPGQALGVLAGDQVFLASAVRRAASPLNTSWSPGKVPESANCQNV